MVISKFDMPENQREVAEAARGFMPKDEGLALYSAARSVAVEGPWLEVGSYCGKSACYFGYAAQQVGTHLFCVDHHRGSEENQAGWEHHEADLVDGEIGLMDTLPHFRKTIYNAGLEQTAIAIVGNSVAIASHWKTPLALLFIDGGHGSEPAHNDYEHWTPKIKSGGLLLIHDVFPDPKDGGRPPYEIYCRALEDGCFTEVSHTGSLRVLQRQ